MRFLKEYLGLFFIIVFVIGSNFFIESKTKQLAKEIESNIDTIIEKILNKENYNKDDTLKKIENFENKWKDSEEKLSYFAEHNELEKVSVDIIDLKSSVIMDDKVEAYKKIEEIRFYIEHIKNKQKLKLNNIF